MAVSCRPFIQGFFLRMLTSLMSSHYPQCTIFYDSRKFKSFNQNVPSISWNFMSSSLSSSIPVVFVYCHQIKHVFRKGCSIYKDGIESFLIINIQNTLFSSFFVQRLINHHSNAEMKHFAEFRFNCMFYLFIYSL